MMCRTNSEVFIITLRLVACLQMLFFIVLTPLVLWLDLEVLFGKYTFPSSGFAKFVYYIATLSTVALSYCEFYAGFCLFQSTRKRKTAGERTGYLSFWLIATSVFIILDFVTNATLYFIGNYSAYMLLSWIIPLTLFSCVTCSLPLHTSQTLQRLIMVGDAVNYDDDEAVLIAVPADKIKDYEFI